MGSSEELPGGISLDGGGGVRGRITPERKDYPSEHDLCFEHTSGSGVVEGGGWYASMIF